MEKDGFFAGSANPNNFNWQEMNNNNNNSSTGSGSGSASASAGVDQLAATSSSNCFLNLNWDQSPAAAAAAAAAAADQTANFESALSSLVSSPTSSSAPIPNDSVVIRELIGRLGSICNPNDNPNSNSNSPPGSQYHSTNTSCYTTPLNSPPKLNLSIMMDHRGQLLPGGIPPQHYHSVPFAADPGFVERAARYSAFGTGAGAGAGPRSFTNPQLGPGGVAEPRKLSRVSSSQSLKAAAAAAAAAAASNSMPPNQMTGQLENDAMMRTMMMTMMRSGASPSAGGPEESSASDHRMAASGSEGNVRKRKAKAKDAPAPPPPPPPKMADEENSNAKRSRSAEEGGADTGMPQKVEKNGEPAQKQPKDKLDKEKENNAKPAEPPKQDYIHVRARRGQATDSHSLAERVRREKISERMKFLQDLVPGCNKVTGKAVMLDEIINYVQSLQRQVEFLSMKLATVNPRLEFNADNLLPKDTQQPAPGLLPSSHLSFPLDQATSTAFSYSKQPQGQGLPPHPTLQSFLTNGGLESQCPVNPLDAGLHRSLSMHLPPLDGGFMDVASQLGAFWEDDLQSVVQMGFGQQNQLESISSSHNLQGALPSNHMKIEL